MPLLGATGGGSAKGFGALANLGYFIRNSLRFRASASAFLNRTPASASNRKTWTWSGWVKRGSLATGAGQILFSTGPTGAGQTWNQYYFETDNKLTVINFVGGSASFGRQSDALYRDPSAWYHVVIAFDTTQATDTNRIKFYINGTQITTSTTSGYSAWPDLNYDGPVNNTVTHGVGGIASNSYLDGYLAEVNFIDGQALTPSSFGKTDAATGQWIPKKFAGTYGTNGFYLKFADASAATAAAIGKDTSPNGNNWTPNNISVTAGTTYDAMIDSPTLSAAASNYAVANPLDKESNITVAQGNLNISTTAGQANKQIRATIALPTTGKWYWETTNSGSANNFNAGITQLTASLSVEGAGDLLYNEGGVINNNGTTTSGYSTLALNDVMGLAYDADANKLYFYKNNTLVNSGGTTPSATGPFAPMFGLFQNGNAQQINFGQRPFSYTPPAGFKSLNAFNLP